MVIVMNKKNTTVIICCAGMGTRLGIGTTKALLDIYGKPLILRLLYNFSEYDDVRIVVGYQAEKVIKMVNKYRKDILYAFNNEYEKNGPAASMWKALLNARENIIVLDGDLVVEENSMKKILDYDNECIGYSLINSDEPIFLNIKNNKVVGFSNNRTKYVWPGIVKIKKDKIKYGENFIYETFLNSLPIKCIEVKAMEIDTQDDYDRTVNWVKNNYK